MFGDFASNAIDISCKEIKNVSSQAAARKKCAAVETERREKLRLKIVFVYRIWYGLGMWRDCATCFMPFDVVESHPVIGKRCAA